MKSKLKLLIMLRLLVATLFLCFGMITVKETLVLFSLIVAVLLLSIFYVLWLSIGKNLYQLATLQVALDLVLETVLMYITDGFDSAFSALMALSIFSAGLILKPRDGLSSAFAGSLLFVAMVIYGQSRQPSDFLYVSYISYVKVSIYLIVGFLSTAFAKRINWIEEELRLKERLSYLGEMAAQLAHEIRNPLTSITGAVQLLITRMEAELPEKDRKLMRIVESETARLNKLLDGVLHYTREDDTEFEKASVPQILDEIFLALGSSQNAGHQVKIVKSYQNTEHSAEVDRAKIKQVFLNIISNSFDAMPSGGTLKVNSVRDNGMIKISFEDTGCGMNREQQKRIFQPFFSNKDSGTGIGLALAQKIVRRHGGDITFKSKEGKGTTFVVSLPQA